MDNQQNKTYRIALDAMGGDFAPTNEIQGAISIFNDPEFTGNVEIVLIGIESKIKTSS